jgi:biotin carboxylase
MMNDETWLVAIGAGRWQMPGIKAAKRAGLKVLAIDGSESAPGLSLADKSAIADIREAGPVISAITASGICPKGAISFCNEAGMLTTAAVREHFNLPGARLETVEAMTRKDRQRHLWTEAGLPCPQWFVVQTLTEAETALSSINATAIVKPVDSAGSRGVTVVQPGSSLQEAFQHALDMSLSRKVIIETFIVGVEHTVETFSHEGQTSVLAITAKKKVPGTSNTVASELASAQMTDEGRDNLSVLCKKALAALEYTDGPGHTEFLLTAEGDFYLVESAGRGGGFMVADGIVPQVSGFDLATACAVQAVGRTPPTPVQQPWKSIVLRFIPSKAGRVMSIAGFDATDEIPGVISEPMVTLGQEVGRASSDGDRMAYILSVAATFKEAQRLADAKEQRISITIQP